ncbi:helix-turn-helix domain-containing protein [Gryllotalpicola koreensis]|uniref:Helix-turn-helix domain-containing protein n=1 Tax=Gryllotalpicola koreensis TaxID=993086 RepID=A0ABP8A6P0_9MICO
MTVETSEYLAMVRRMLRAAGKRVADADEVELAELVALRAELEQAIASAVDGQHERGVSWRGIAAGLGVNRSAAHERYARKVSG